MSAPWFHHADLAAAPEGSVIELDPAEGKHAAGAKRLGPGDAVVLFDGSGLIARAVLEQARHARDRSVRVRIERIERTDPSRPRVELACALPKGDRQSVLLSMATQLRMSAFTPLDCERGVAEAGPGFEPRARRIMLEACKQCRQAHLPTVNPAAKPLAVVQRVVADGGLAILAHPGGEPIARAVRAWITPSTTRIALLVGPEGGFTDAEVAAMRGAGARPVDLGPVLLRVETAAVALLAHVMLHEAAP